MIEMIRTFLEKTKQRDHVLRLIKATDSFMICFITQQESVSLSLKNGGISLLHDSVDLFNHYEIYGELAALEDLLAGKERLRVLVHRGKLKISAPFRVVLLLESLFYLTKDDEKMMKII